MSEEEVSFSLEGAGRARVCERGEQSKQGWWESIELVESEDDEIGFSIRAEYDDNEDKRLTISLSFAHVPNPETNRAFHGTVDFYIPPAQLTKLRAFIGYLIEHEKPEEQG